MPGQCLEQSVPGARHEDFDCLNRCYEMNFFPSCEIMSSQYCVLCRCRLQCWRKRTASLACVSLHAVVVHTYSSLACYARSHLILSKIVQHGININRLCLQSVRPCVIHILSYSHRVVEPETGLLARSDLSSSSIMLKSESAY